MYGSQQKFPNTKPKTTKNYLQHKTFSEEEEEKDEEEEEKDEEEEEEEEDEEEKTYHTEVNSSNAKSTAPIQGKY